ncbi:MAG TPA: electron transfer flavoprotein subunit beta/FixA family protein [Firmicutes bacterium]|nr:electron transfer flavoprotein subunit beta/FixA family protein [Bacillota bacterium]
MRIVVCIKQVPATLDVRVDPVTHNLIREGTDSVINSFDENALEEALRLKEQLGGTVAVVSMGPPQVKEALRKALAMGADEAFLLCDRALGGADTLATAYTLAQAIRRLAPFDLILCGRHAVDADTGQVGPELAERLNLPQVTLVKKLVCDGKSAIAWRECEEGTAVWEVPLPAVVTVGKEINTPRYPSPIGIMRAARKPLTVWTAKDLDVEEDRIGLKGSPTRVLRLFSPQRTSHVEMLTGKPEEAAAALVAKLREQKVLQV